MPGLTLFAAGSTALAAVGGGAADNFVDVSTLNPASPPAESIRFLFYVVTAASAFILLVVWGVLFYSLIRFRRRNSTASSKNQPLREPPQVYGSMPIEIAWTVAPALIVFLLTLVIIRTEYEVRVNPSRHPADAKPVKITVIGHQWWWEYIIEHDGERELKVVTANEIHIPASSEEQPRPIYLTLKSADVCHSYWVPRLAGKTDLIPGRPNQMWFESQETGLYYGQCAEYCGTQHANMMLHVYVDSEEDFAQWLANEERPAVDDPAVRAGKEAFLAESCVNCHTIRGTPADGKFGPDLTHLASRATFAGGMIKLNRKDLRDWIHDPQDVKLGCLMPAFGLEPEQVDLIADYLMTLK